MQVSECTMTFKWKNNGSQVIRRQLKKNNVKSLVLTDIPKVKL